MGDCQLDCVKKVTQGVHDFVGPVKIVLVDPSAREYRRKMWGTAILAFAVFLMGWTTLSMIFYTLAFMQRAHSINVHIYFCTVGYQLLLLIGIINFNRLNGPAIVMKVLDRRFEHMVTQITGVTFGVLGGFIGFFITPYTFKERMSWHCIFGMTTGGTAVAATVFGVMMYLRDKWTTYENNPYLRYMHITLACACIINATICFITGVIKPSIRLFFEPMPYMVDCLWSFCLFYTAVFLFDPVKKAFIERKSALRK